MEQKGFESRSGGIDHIGLAVFSIENALDFYQHVLGMRLSVVEEVVSERVRVAILFHGSQRIELLEALDKRSPIHSFLSKKGEGLHHVAYRVGNIMTVLAHIRQTKPNSIISPAPRAGAENCQVAFLHPKHSHGLLTELVERPPEKA